MYFCEARTVVDLDPEAWDRVSETFLNYHSRAKIMHDVLAKDVEKLISESRKCFSMPRYKRRRMDDCSARDQAKTEKKTKNDSWFANTRILYDYKAFPPFKIAVSKSIAVKIHFEHFDANELKSQS